MNLLTTDNGEVEVLQRKTNVSSIGHFLKVAMPSQFDYYRRALPGAETRMRHLWQHESASFTKQLENFGLPIGWGWGGMAVKIQPILGRPTSTRQFKQGNGYGYFISDNI